CYSHGLRDLLRSDRDLRGCRGGKFTAWSRVHLHSFDERLYDAGLWLGAECPTVSGLPLNAAASQRCQTFELPFTSTAVVGFRSCHCGDRSQYEAIDRAPVERVDSTPAPRRLGTA